MMRPLDTIGLERGVWASVPHRARQYRKGALVDGSRFDAWTRRRFGLAAGGLAGSLLALVHAGQDDVTATKKKKKKKKKRCGRLGAFCNPDGKPGCCGGLTCDIRFFGTPFCCVRGGESCETGHECCSGECTTDFKCYCKDIDDECFVDGHCCSYNCDGGQCKAAL
jgi:hypothetical protein